MRWGFLLSHHPPEAHDRCLRIGGVPVCARCLGLYPTLALGMILLFWTGGGWPLQEQESTILTVLTLPALIDWAHGLFVPRPGGKARRLFTGILLGVALSRVLYLHWLDPFSPPVLDVLGILAAGAALAGVLRWRLGGPDLDGT